MRGGGVELRENCNEGIDFHWSALLDALALLKNFSSKNKKREPEPAIKDAASSASVGGPCHVTWPICWLTVGATGPTGGTRTTKQVVT